MKNNNQNLSSILLKVNGISFLLESEFKLNKESRNYIRELCSNAFEEDSSFKLFLKQSDTDISDMSSYEIAELFIKIVKLEMDIDINFKCIDLEVNIE